MYYLKKIVSFTRQDFQLLKSFGLKTAYYNFAKNYIFRKNKGIGKRYYVKKYENAYQIIKNKYFDNKIFDTKQEVSNISENEIIWLFWWQGIDESAPYTIKKCIENINKYKKNHKLIIISKDNMSEFITLPSYIFEKVNNGNISLVQLSDIIRAELLYTYGGIWMDSTVLLTDHFDKNMYNYSFYTIKHNQFSDFHISSGLWSGFFLAAGKGHPLFLIMRTIFREYWKNEDVLIAYLLIDIILKIGYEDNMEIKEDIDNVPTNNTLVFYLDDHANDTSIDQLSESIFKENYLHKLHYKRNFSRVVDNEVTLFGRLTNPD